jgi:type IV pilus assembly protein PilA
MSSPARRVAARGFTLIELMTVTAIIGILASVAIPSFAKLTLRAKSAERMTLMLRIKTQIQDYWVRNGRVVPAAYSGTLASGYNPPGLPGMTKRVMVNSIPAWNVYFSAAGGGGSVTTELEGATYYSYYIQNTESAAATRIWVWAIGNLDGDANYSYKDMWWDKQNGIFVLNYDFPPDGQEDDSSSYATF